jgi:hypothetical protein
MFKLNITRLKVLLTNTETLRYFVTTVVHICLEGFLGVEKIRKNVCAFTDNIKYVTRKQNKSYIQTDFMDTKHSHVYCLFQITKSEQSYLKSEK